MNNILRLPVAFALVLTLFLAPLVAMAAQGSLTLQYGLEYNTNILGAPGDEEEDLSNRAAVDLVIDDLGRRFQYAVDASLFYQEYETQGVDDDYGLDGGIRGTLSIVEDRLDWVIQNAASERRINSSSLSSVGNSEWVNNFSTGPRWNMRLGDRSTLSLGANYSRTYFEVSKEDELESMSFNGEFMHAFSKLTQLGIAASTTEAERGGLGFEDTRDTVNFLVSRTFKKSSLNLSFGRSFIDSEAASSLDFGVYSVDFVTQVSKKVRASLDYNRSVITDGETLAQRLNSLGIDTSQFSKEQVEATINILESQFGFDGGALRDGSFEVSERAQATINGEQSSWVWNLGAFQQKVENANRGTEVENNEGILLGFQVIPSQRVRIGIDGQIEQRSSSGIDADETTLSVQADYQFSKSLSTRVRLRTQTRDQDGAQDIEVNEIIFSLLYKV